MAVSLRLQWLLPFWVVVLAGCSSLSTEPPAHYNLTGDWRVNSALSDTPNLAALSRSSSTPEASGQHPGRGQGGMRGGGGQRSGKGTDGRRGGSQSGPPPSGSTRKGKQGPINVPVLVASSMTIDQNGESMGIQYDGTTYRDVSWGKRKRDDQKIEAGWKVQDLIIKTKGGRIDVEEKYILSDDGRRLTIFVALAGSRDDMAFKRVFEKQAT